MLPTTLMCCLCDSVLFGDFTPQPLLQTEETWNFVSPSSVCFIQFIILVALPLFLLKWHFILLRVRRPKLHTILKMQAHEDLTQQQNNAVHSIVKIPLDDGQDFCILKTWFWPLLQNELMDSENCESSHDNSKCSFLS